MSKLHQMVSATKKANIKERLKRNENSRKKWSWRSISKAAPCYLCRPFMNFQTHLQSELKVSMACCSHQKQNTQQTLQGKGKHNTMERRIYSKERTCPSLSQRLVAIFGQKPRGGWRTRRKEKKHTQPEIKAFRNMQPSNPLKIRT